MAKVWLARYGVPATSGPALVDRPLMECVKKLKVNKTAVLGDLRTKVQFGSPDDAMASVNGFHHVVVMVGETEARANGWKPGFYLAMCTAHEACQRLGVKQPPLPPRIEPKVTV